MEIGTNLEQVGKKSVNWRSMRLTASLYILGYVVIFILCVLPSAEMTMTYALAAYLAAYTCVFAVIRFLTGGRTKGQLLVWGLISAASIGLAYYAEQQQCYLPPGTIIDPRPGLTEEEMKEFMKMKDEIYKNGGRIWM